MARPCVLDASFLLALGKAGQLDLLRVSTTYAWQIGPISRGELMTADTKHPIEQMILDGTVQQIDPDSDDETAMDLFGTWSELVDPGEAESIALALSGGALVALEDVAAQRKVDREVGAGHWINCANLLIDLVRQNALNLAEANNIFVSLEVFGGYAKRGIHSLKESAPSL